MADALIYLHGKHVTSICRDIKPENLLLGINGELKIAISDGACMRLEIGGRRCVERWIIYQVEGREHTERVDYWALALGCFDVRVRFRVPAF